MKPTAPKAYLFDIGNVLVRFDFTPGVRKLLAESTRAPADPLAAILGIKDEFEAGRLEVTPFVLEAIRLLGYRGTPEDFLAIWNDIFIENEPMTRQIRILADAGHPLFLLSNTNPPHLRFLRANFDVFRYFQGGIYSHEAGAMKPGEAIYHAAIARCGLLPEETLYIDDLADNIATGTRLGFLTHHYHPDRHAEFEAVLEDFGVLSRGPE